MINQAKVKYRTGSLIIKKKITDIKKDSEIFPMGYVWLFCAVLVKNFSWGGLYTIRKNKTAFPFLHTAFNIKSLT